MEQTGTSQHFERNDHKIGTIALVHVYHFYIVIASCICHITDVLYQPAFANVLVKNIRETLRILRKSVLLRHLYQRSLIFGNPRSRSLPSTRRSRQPRQPMPLLRRPQDQYKTEATAVQIILVEDTELTLLKNQTRSKTPLETRSRLQAKRNYPG